MDDDIDHLLEQGIKAAANGGGGEHASMEDAGSSRYKDSSRRDRPRSRSREHRRDHRDRRDRSRERDSRRKRSRSRSRDSRRSRRRSKSHSRSRSKDRKEPAAPEPPRARSTSQERIERAKQRELMELTRDHRTVFVGQLTQKVRERDLEKFFGSLAKLEHVLLIRDKFTNKSKGFAYVEFSNLEDIPKVLLVNGQVPSFQSFPILIKASEAEKNFAARKDAVFSSGPTTKASASGYSSSYGGSSSGGGGSSSGLSLSAASRVYVGNLHGNINEDDVKAVFSAFGEVVSVALNRDDIGRSKGFGFVQFTTPDEANLALTKANGLEVAGNFLKVGPVREHEGSGYGRDSGPSAFNNKGYGAGGGNWKLEDEEGSGGYALNSQSRSALMAKLAGGAGASSLALPTLQPNNPLASNPVAPSVSLAQTQRAAALAGGDIEGVDSVCFVVKNMFDLYKERRSGNPDWHVEIQQDVVDECSRYGKVVHSFVEKDKEGGLVYICFDALSAAREAAHRLHGRWFNMRQISLRFMPTQEYVGMFPSMRSVIAAVKQR
ncbi:hypothetical protein H310_10659 [Aphanomyces invadans]|uniref:RRM domain-containing protein n=1 Tax=Aphanomyces invadans TaxID=157072 RepID=A0A024TPT4_9STRA|nr:hypothetical protein H310_10659 [Aphanomyces invadans]ETV96004.1 hypothetical protein H310_10659 [Aphanomyces invadans]|eukprot:XP_008875315.1 hypothetical protein H310_10659 [Aphanomyces invadans]